MVTGGEPGNTGSGLDNDAGGFVAHHCRHGPWSQSLDRREIRVTKACGGDFHEDFPLSGTVQIDSFDLERLALRKGTLEPLLIHNGSSHFHRSTSVGFSD
jgi:hypothetical protein